MAILSSFVTLEGKFAVQVAAHQKQGLCLYMSHLHRCKWFKRLPSTMRPAAIDGGALLNAALENKYASLAETTRDRLLNALYPGRKKELKMSEAKVRISNNATIATITEGVKKRAAAAERFALYQVGMTVTEYVAAGGKRGDIAYDLEHNFITVDQPVEPEAAKGDAAPAPKRSRKGKTVSAEELAAAHAE